MDAAYQLTQYNWKHQLKWRGKLTPSHSFVKAFLQMLYCNTTNLSQNIIDISNTSRAVDGGEASLRVLHPGLSAGDDSGGDTLANILTPYSNVYSDECGIQVGTSSTAVAVADDNLVAPVAHGTSAGQMVYYGCYGLNYTTGASSASFDIERILRNSSGGSIVIAEIGVYCRAAFGASSYDEDEWAGFCILRDVLGATVTVLNGEYLKVKYTITVSN